MKEKIGDDEVPADVLPIALDEDVVQIAAGDQHACALLVSGKLRCWGGNGSGQLGIGSQVAIGDDELPTSVPALEIKK